MPANLENAAVATRLEKVLFSFQSQRRAMPKNVQTTTQLCSFHILAKKCSKSFKLGFNSTWTENFQIYKLDLEKAEEPGNKLPMSVGSTKKQKDSRKTSTSVSLTRLKPWLCGSEQTVENSSRVGNTSPPYLPPEKSVYRSRSNRSGHRTKGWLKIR